MPPTRLAGEGSELEAAFLQLFTHGSRRPGQAVRDVRCALAGHLGRSGDGPTG